MTRSAILPALAMLVGCASAAVQGETAADRRLRAECDRIAASVRDAGDGMRLLKELTDSIGARLAGSPAFRRATQWGAERMRGAGVETVALESYSIPNGWERISARGRIIGAAPHELHIGSVGWSPSTKPGGVTASVVTIADLAPEAIRARAADFKGRIALVETDKAIPDDDPMAFARLRGAFEPLARAGVAAVLLPGDVPGNALGAWVDTANARGTVLPLPVAEIGRDDAQVLRTGLETGPVTAEIGIENRVSGPVQVHNVLGEIRGRDKAGEWVLVGAHLDSWDLAAGAHDNATGSVMVLEAARALAALERAPKRSIRFALWAAEEPGIPGSAVYAHRHAAELGRCVAVLNMDNGAGPPRGWKTGGRADVLAAMQPLSDQVLAPLGGGGLAPVLDCGSDHCPFLLEGVPILNQWVDTTLYREVHHKAGDTLDKVDPRHFKANAAVVAVTAWLLAERQERLAMRLDAQAVAGLLRGAGLDPELVGSLWTP